MSYFHCREPSSQVTVWLLPETVLSKLSTQQNLFKLCFPLSTNSQLNTVIRIKITQTSSFKFWRNFFFFFFRSKRILCFPLVFLVRFPCQMENTFVSSNMSNITALFKWSPQAWSLGCPCLFLRIHPSGNSSDS